jgi:hypothetical protein
MKTTTPLERHKMDSWITNTHSHKGLQLCARKYRRYTHTFFFVKYECFRDAEYSFYGVLTGDTAKSCSRLPDVRGWPTAYIVTGLPYIYVNSRSRRNTPQSVDTLNVLYLLLQSIKAFLTNRFVFSSSVDTHGQTLYIYYIGVERLSETVCAPASCVRIMTN